MYSQQYIDPLESAEQYLYTETQRAVLDKARLAGARTLGPLASQVDESASYPHESMTAIHEAGLAGLAVPVNAGGWGGGFGGDLLLIPLVVMELASYCSSTAQIFTLHNTGIQLVRAFGTEEQRRYFFEEALQGHWFASFGSEPGKERFKLNSELKAVEGGYLLNGTKIFATGSLGATWAVWRSVLADTDGAKGQDERYTLPLVRLNSNGIKIVDDWDGIGQRGTGSGQAVARDAFVPEQHLIGAPGSHAEVADFFNAQFNINFAAQFTGIAKGALREAVGYLHERSQGWPVHEVPPTEDRIVRLRLGECSARIAAARQTVIHAARVLQASAQEEGLTDAVQIAASHAKIIATEAALEVTSTLFQIMGARSATRRFNFDRYYRNARTLTLHDPVDRHAELVGGIEVQRGYM